MKIHPTQDVTLTADVHLMSEVDTSWNCTSIVLYLLTYVTAYSYTVSWYSFAQIKPN